MAENIFLPFLEENPNILYGAYTPKSNNSNFLNYFRSQYGNVYQDYLGKLGSMALGGQTPNLGFNDYLQGYPFLQAWYKMSPGSRGENTSGSLPGLKWNV